MATATTNRDLGHEAWRFIREHWEEAIERFASTNIITLASGVRFLTLPGDAAEAAAFFETHHIPQAGLMLDQALERQQINTALRTRATAELAEAFTIV